MTGALAPWPDAITDLAGGGRAVLDESLDSSVVLLAIDGKNESAGALDQGFPGPIH